MFKIVINVNDGCRRSFFTRDVIVIGSVSTKSPRCHTCHVFKHDKNMMKHDSKRDLGTIANFGGENLHGAREDDADLNLFLNG